MHASSWRGHRLFYVIFPFLLPLIPQPTLSFWLVLNKCDLLQAKLQRGVRIRDSVPSFGDRKNDLPTATRCASSFISCTLSDPSLFRPDFQTHFKEIARQHSTVPRPFYVHLTSVIVRILLLSMGFTQDTRSFVPRPFLQDSQSTAVTLGAGRNHLCNACITSF